MQSCCFPIASACPPIVSASAAARCLRLFESAAAPWPDCRQLLLPVCVRFQPDCARFSCCCMLAACVHFSCCSRLHPLRLLLPNWVTFDCCSPIGSPSAAAPQLGHLRLLLPDWVTFDCCSPIGSPSAAAPRLGHLRLLLPDWVTFGCCSPIGSPSTAAPRLGHLRLLLPDWVTFGCCSPIGSPSTAARLSARGLTIECSSAKCSSVSAKRFGGMYTV